jgi:CDP-diacylglycerol--serine O-phosphatidyltransferase
MVGPLIVLVVLAFALLIAYPWIVLTAGTLAYLACLPFGWLSYRRYERRSHDSKPDQASAPPMTSSSPTIIPGMVQPKDDDERPSRLN